MPSTLLAAGHCQGAAIPYNSGIAIMGFDIFLHHDPPSDSWGTIATGSSQFSFGYYTAAAVAGDNVVVSRGYLLPVVPKNYIKVCDPVSNRWSRSTAGTKSGTGLRQRARTRSTSWLAVPTHGEWRSTVYTRTRPSP